jgi:tetratricopeptide (TPR) repeat protein
VEEFGPDDFYTLTRYLRKHIESMSLEELLACVRLAHHDATQFARYLPRLLALAPELDAQRRSAVVASIERVWALYFPLGDAGDLAFDIGRLLYEMDDYRGAIRFFEQSLAAYGEHAGTLCNIAMCRRMLGEDVTADALLRRVAEYEPAKLEAEAPLRRAIPARPG